MIILIALIATVVLWCLFKSGQSINGADYSPARFAADCALALVIFAGTYGLLKALL